MVYTYALFSGYYCIIVWKRRGYYELVYYRKYIIRIVAVSQEHVLVCITRKATRRGNDMVLVLVSKLTWFLYGWSKETWFLCGEWELTSPQFRDQNWLGFVWESNMAWFKVRIEINLAFVWVGMQNWVIRVGINIDLSSVLGSKLTWF